MDFHILRMQGLSIRRIAALRGVSHNAVRRALRSPQEPTGKRHRLKGLKLVPYVDTTRRRYMVLAQLRIEVAYIGAVRVVQT